LADAACGSFDLMKELSAVGATGTFSMSGKIKPWLWDLLCTKAELTTWRAAKTDDGFIVSVNLGQNQKKTKVKAHKLLTNAFDIDVDEGLYGSASSEKLPSIHRKEELESLTVPKLKEICGAFNIRPGNKRKAELIEHMVTILSIEGSVETEVLMKKLDTVQNTNPAVHHLHYKKHFNGVDLVDRMWYRLPYNYSVKNWNTAYFYGIFKMALYMFSIT